MTDSELRAMLRTNKRQAHMRLFDEYFGYVYSIVFRKLRGVAGREDVEECVSDVFADVFFSYDAGSAHNGDLRGFISAVANRRAVDMYRSLSRQKGRTVPMDTLAEQAADINIAETAEQSEQSRTILRCIEELGEPDAAIVLQRYYFGRSAGEVAQSLSLSSAAVRMRCSRALKRLKGALAAHGIEG